MSTLEKLYRSRLGKSVARKAGLSDPPTLRRGDSPPTGPVAVAAASRSDYAQQVLSAIGCDTTIALRDTPESDTPTYEQRLGAVIVDAIGLTSLGELEEVRAALRPALKALEPSGRVVLIARPASGEWEQHAVAQALDGIVRSVAKELRRGATANLLLVEEGASVAASKSTLEFLLSGRSAYVSGQVWKIANTSTTEIDEASLEGKVVAVTGAARGIGAEIARVVAARGARVLCIDIPMAGESLAAVANEINGVAIQLDITESNAGQTIAQHAARWGGLFGIVHNAGITRDKLLVNTDAERWASVLQVNLQAQMAINTTLLSPGLEGGLVEGGRIVGVASTSGIAGNRGQANYAASKAGVAGLVRAMAPDLAARKITVNAVAPGFIQTEMTAKIPFVQREIFQRTNSLGQGGLPVDVAETISYFLQPDSTAITGQVIRVCGQNVVGQ